MAGFYRVSVWRAYLGNAMINTKVLLGSTGAAMTVFGAALIFLPHEVARGLALRSTAGLLLPLQLLGALYYAYGMLNWLAKANPMGGIYGRPIGLANLTHFTVGGFALVRAAVVDPRPVVIAAAILYGVSAAVFASVVFGPPPFAKRG